MVRPGLAAELVVALLHRLDLLVLERWLRLGLLVSLNVRLAHWHTVAVVLRRGAGFRLCLCLDSRLHIGFRLGLDLFTSSASNSTLATGSTLASGSP